MLTFEERTQVCVNSMSALMTAAVEIFFKKSYDEAPSEIFSIPGDQVLGARICAGIEAIHTNSGYKVKYSPYILNSPRDDREDTQAQYSMNDGHIEIATHTKAHQSTVHKAFSTVHEWTHHHILNNPWVVDTQGVRTPEKVYFIEMGGRWREEVVTNLATCALMKCMGVDLFDYLKYYVASDLGRVITHPRAPVPPQNIPTLCTGAMDEALERFQRMSVRVEMLAPDLLSRHLPTGETEIKITGILDLDDDEEYITALQEGGFLSL